MKGEDRQVASECAVSCHGSIKSNGDGDDNSITSALSSRSALVIAEMRGEIERLKLASDNERNQRDYGKQDIDVDVRRHGCDNSLVDEPKCVGVGGPGRSTPEPLTMGQLCLPKVELMTFDGTTTEYWKFIKQFEYYVEAKVVDYGQRLLYLMYYCRGRAREAMEGCMMLPPPRAYVRARGILK